MKKIISAILCITMMLSCVSAFAQTAATTEIYVDGVKLECDVAPIIENDRTLVPMRSIFEALGVTIHWDGETKTVFAKLDETVILLQIGNTLAFVNGEERHLDVPAQIVNDRTLVPARFASEALNAHVEWDDVNRVVNITTAN